MNGPYIIYLIFINIIKYIFVLINRYYFLINLYIYIMKLKNKRNIIFQFFNSFEI